MFEIGSGGELSERFIGELLAEQDAEALGEAFATDASGSAIAIAAREFEAARLALAEALDFESQAMGLAFHDAGDAASESAFSGPEMEQRFGTGPNFVARGIEAEQAAAVFRDLDGGAVAEAVEGLFEFVCGVQWQPPL